MTEVFSLLRVFFTVFDNARAVISAKVAWYDRFLWIILIDFWWEYIYLPRTDFILFSVLKKLHNRYFFENKDFFIIFRSFRLFDKKFNKTVCTMAGYIRSFTIAEWVSEWVLRKVKRNFPLFVVLGNPVLLHIIWDFSATLFKKVIPLFILNLLCRQQTKIP